MIRLTLIAATLLAMASMVEAQCSSCPGGARNVLLAPLTIPSRVLTPVARAVLTPTSAVLRRSASVPRNVNRPFLIARHRH